jgi:hypothetical protein
VEHEDRKGRRLAALFDVQLGIRDLDQPTHRRTSGQS